MNMTFKDKYNINTEFEDIFAFDSNDDKIEHEAKMIMFRFLSELEKINAQEPFKKKDLALAIKTSPSYITQLYRGDKLINLLTLAKIQEAYKIIFDIKAKRQTVNYKQEIEERSNSFFTENKMTDNGGYWLYVSKNPDYQNNDVEQLPSTKISLKVA